METIQKDKFSHITVAANPRTHDIRKKQKKQPPPPAPAPAPTTPTTPPPPKKEIPKAPEPKPSPPTPNPQKNSVLPPTPSQLVNSGGTKTTPPATPQTNANPIPQVPQRPQSKAAPPQTLPSKDKSQNSAPQRLADSSHNLKKKDSPLPSQGFEPLSSKHPVGTAAKNTAAFVAHNAIEIADDLVLSPLVGLVGNHKMLEAPPDHPTLSVKEGYEQDMDTLHRKVDQFLKTDQADQYTQEAKANRFPNVVMGIAPPPIGLGARGVLIANQEIKASNLIKAGEAIDKGGYTKAGRALMKHGYREGSVFPKPIGTPKEINTQGKMMLESILNNPESLIYERSHNKFGKIIDIVTPEKQGVRFTIEGEMIGFLEPVTIK